MKPQVLTIAGSDSGGGAGIQADLKTITMHNCYGLSVITALTAQNTQGVQSIQPVDPDFVRAQLESVFSDFTPQAVKIGMVFNRQIILVIEEILRKYTPRHVIVDPVMIASSGDSLLSQDSISALRENLFPLATLITPNCREGSLLADMNLDRSVTYPAGVGKIWNESGQSAAIYLKGGDLDEDECRDLLFDGEESHWFTSPRIETKNSHGTGCTLSSALACNLAKGLSLRESAERAKVYINRALLGSQYEAPGRGIGPLNHNFLLDH